jgi:hypothetical protein
MNKQRLVIIDGPYTLISNEHFIKDEIPRMLAKYIDDDYKIWMINVEVNDDTFFLKNTSVPQWLKENVMMISIETFKGLSLSEYNKKDSFILTDNHERVQSYGKKLTVYHLNDLFKNSKYEPLNIADLILCFGFEKSEFTNFCQQSNLLGVSENKTIKTTMSLNPDGVAFHIKKNDIKIVNEVKHSQGILNDMIKNNQYKIRHYHNILGVTNKGKGLDHVNLEYMGIELPLLSV